MTIDKWLAILQACLQFALWERFGLCINRLDWMPYGFGDYFERLDSAT